MLSKPEQGNMYMQNKQKDENNLESGFRLYPSREEAIGYPYCTTLKDIPMLCTSLHNNSR